MFNWTNTTLINSNVDALSGRTLFTGADDVFRVLRVGKFNKDNVRSVYKREGYNGVLSTATFTPPTAPTEAGAEDFYRIELFMKLSGNQTSTFATAATVYKSKPIHIEFKVETGDSASDIADKMVKAVKFYQQNLYPYIKVSKSGNNVVISGCDEYEVFLKAELQKLTSAAVSVYPDDQNKYTKVSSATIANGKEGFGTYMNITKNLRLPTLEQVRFTSPTLDELPVIGALYNQYTIEYCAERGPMGSDVVGDLTKSITHNVFFVNQTLAAEFEAALTGAGLTITTVTDSGDVAGPTVAVKPGQTVSKANTSGTALIYTVDGVEKTTGGTWTLVGSPTGITLTGNTIKATESTTVTTVTVKVAYQSIEAQGTVQVTA